MELLLGIVTNVLLSYLSHAFSLFIGKFELHPPNSLNSCSYTYQILLLLADYIGAAALS